MPLFDPAQQELWDRFNSAKLFRQYLSPNPAHGSAVWHGFTYKTAPLPEEEKVEIGDVGYYTNFQFVRCFNVFLKADEKINHLGAPLEFQSLKPLEDQGCHARVLTADHVLVGGKLEVESLPKDAPQPQSG